MASIIFTLALFFLQSVVADISHFLSHDFDHFLHPQPEQKQQQQQQFATYPVSSAPTQPSVPSLYELPPLLPPTQPGGIPAIGDVSPSTPAPAVPTISTHSPVAPVRPSTSTEFTLPEIVENRSAKSGGGRFNFIPLQNQYLAPAEDRPNYDIAKPRPPSFGAGYFYPRPTSNFIPTTSTTSTTEYPKPIVVVDPTDILPSIQAPGDNEPVALQPPTDQGYNYNVPAGPPFQLPTQPPPSTPAPIYLPPDDNSIEGSAVASNALRLRVHEMRCMQQSGGYFRAVLKVDSFIGATPTVDNDASDKRCELKLARSYVVTDIAEEDFEKCGVHECGKDLCLRLRFPTIRGMRTSTDGILTLHCKIQERVAVKTHALKMSVSNEVQARSLGTYAHGGTQLPFRTHVELFRRTPKGFTRQLDTDSAVLLGEELLLRAHVIAGDGWSYTKLTDVNVQRISPTGELLNNVALITSRGCINPSMQSVCSQPPSYDPPLGHRLSFKAVMFQGMRSGDELVLSMRITGCLEARDCHVDASNCSAITNLWRRKRNTNLSDESHSEYEKRASNGAEVSEISRIAFRVMMPKGVGEEIKEGVDITRERAANNEQIESTSQSLWQKAHSNMVVEMSAVKLISALGFVLLLTGLGIFAAVKLTK
ncbi:uncharacterized protein LOC101451116 [Ceratitis capitata]|uniref:uncharacterized protein LOC101451116 n=1 Tax=Ceratitis capitata TaxID=7213 RepID=UPI000329A169|nr:uncharacterized protein LOC101451116 [Ceratitis capitata]